MILILGFNEKMSHEAIKVLIEKLEIPSADKQRLLAMTPASYIGKAAELAKRV
jgi:adenylosuccinate lyase